VAYYRTAEGKEKKKLHNGKRGRGASARWRPGEGQGIHIDADIVRYVAMVVSLIERRRVSEWKIRKMLARAVRQHRMARRRRIDYVLHYLTDNSP
jgi:hypothetical protein